MTVGGTECRFTAISGARQDSSARCYLLEVYDSVILLDVGLDPLTLDPSSIVSMLETVAAEQIKAVLISHGDVEHMGALCLIAGRLNCPVYCTTPVAQLGRIALLEARSGFMQRHGAAPAALESEESIDTVCEERVTMLRYSQPVQVDTVQGLTIMAIPAGHSLGGAIWRIRKASALEDIVYAVDFNHRREAVLDGAALDLVIRPSLLIADARQALTVGENRKDRNANIVSAIKSAISKSSASIVLIPIEGAARSLELLYLLDKHWAEERPSATLCLLSSNGSRLIDHCKGLLEWMGGGLMRSFEQDRENPFNMAHLRLVGKLQDLDVIPGLKVVLCPLAYAQGGPSFSLISRLAAQKETTILFPEPPVHGSVAHKLLQASNGGELILEFSEAVPLEGAELAKFNRERQLQKEQQAADAVVAKIKDRRRKLASDSAGDVTDSESDEESEEALDEQTKKEQELLLLKEIYWPEYRTDWWVDEMQNVDPTIFGLDALPLRSKVRFQVFPALAKTHQRQTDYGEPVPPDFFPAAHQAAADQGSDLVQQAKQAIRARLKQEREDAERFQGPVKWVASIKKLSVRCTRKLIPGFEALSDGRSLKNLISQVNPKRLILIGGAAEPTDYLFNHYQYAALSSNLLQVEAPCVGSTVLLSSTAPSLNAFMSEALSERLRVLKLQPQQEETTSVSGYLVARLRAACEPSSDSSLKLLPFSEKGDADGLGCRSASSSIQRPVMIGEVRLGELRKALLESGVEAMFGPGGDLICSLPTAAAGLQVTVKRMDEGSFAIEGEQGSCLDAVRSIFYRQLAIV